MFIGSISKPSLKTCGHGKTARRLSHKIPCCFPTRLRLNESFHGNHRHPTRPLGVAGIALSTTLVHLICAIATCATCLIVIRRKEAA
jgi:hypothetical protein